MTGPRHGNAAREPVMRALRAAMQRQGLPVRAGRLHRPRTGMVGVRAGTVEVWYADGDRTRRVTVVRFSSWERVWRPHVAAPDFNGDGGYRGRRWVDRLAEDVAAHVLTAARTILRHPHPTVPDLAASGWGRQQDAAAWLADPDDRTAAVAEGVEAWTARMTRRWDVAGIEGQHAPDVCRAAWRAAGLPMEGAW